jgi:hypothetical protein
MPAVENLQLIPNKTSRNWWETRMSRRGLFKLAGGAIAVTAINAACNSTPKKPAISPHVSTEESLSPIPALTPEPTRSTETSLEPDQSMQPSHSQESNPTPSATPGKSPDAHEIQTPDLENILSEWQNHGTYKNKAPKLFPQSWDSKPGPLNILGSRTNPGLKDIPWNNEIFAYQGLLLGAETVDNHLVAYIGLKDRGGKGTPYYIALNAGTLDNKYPVEIAKAGSFTDSKIINDWFLADCAQTEENIQNNIGKSVLFYLATMDLLPPAQPGSNYDFSDIIAQKTYAREFDIYSMHVASGDSYKTAPGARKFAQIINKRVTKVNPSKLPIVATLSVRNYSKK